VWSVPCEDPMDDVAMGSKISDPTSVNLRLKSFVTPHSKFVKWPSEYNMCMRFVGTGVQAGGWSKLPH